MQIATKTVALTILPRAMTGRCLGAMQFGGRCLGALQK